MVKLNNKGFGMSTMLIFIGVFIIVLIAIMVLAYDNGIERDSNNQILEKQGDLFVSPNNDNEEEN